MNNMTKKMVHSKNNVESLFISLNNSWINITKFLFYEVLVITKAKSDFLIDRRVDIWHL